MTVRGRQWWWEFRSPSLGVVTANELHLPAGRPVALSLEGPDVIHSFWVPQLGGKRDVIPGRVNRLTLVPERPGEYWGQCAEFCGASHANMGLRVFVDTPEEFARWPPGRAAARHPVLSSFVNRETSGRPSVRPALPLLAATLGGCAWDGPMSTVVARSDFARDILEVYGIVTWATVVIALVVFVALGWILLRFREKPGAPLPAQTHGHTLLEIAWTVAPALALLVIAIPTIQVIFRTQAAPTAQALDVTVRGRQWWWEFRYPSLGVVTANELHLPAGRPGACRTAPPTAISSIS